jgi:protein Mpv17
MGLYGGCIFGPAATLWFRFLERNVAVNVGRTSQTLIRVGCDQLLFAPMITGVFFSTMAVMEGRNPADKLSESYWTALKANWSLWPAVQTGNFFFVPLHMRVLLVNVVSLGWNSYLSFLNMQKKPEEGIVEVVKEVEEGGKKVRVVPQA